MIWIYQWIFLSYPLFTYFNLSLFYRPPVILLLGWFHGISTIVRVFHVFFFANNYLSLSNYSYLIKRNIYLNMVIWLQAFLYNTNKQYSFIYFQVFLSNTIAQSIGAVEYTDCISAEGRDNPTTTSVLNIRSNNLMVRLQQCRSFGECGVLLHCHRSQVYSGPEW